MNFRQSIYAGVLASMLARGYDARSAIEMALDTTQKAIAAYEAANPEPAKPAKAKAIAEPEQIKP